MPLCFDPNTVLVRGSDVIHVLTRCGSFDLRGKNICLLHDALVNRLPRAENEAAILSAFPAARRAAIGAYLTRLREIGLLRDESVGATRPALQALQALGRHTTRVEYVLPDESAFISLNDFNLVRTRRDAITIGFVDRNEAARLLLELGSVRRKWGRVNCVVIDSPSEGVSPLDMAYRASCARWLLSNELDVPAAAQRIRLYRFRTDDGTCRPEVVVEGGTRLGVGSLAAQLGLVRPIEVEQVPLVVASARHAFFPGAVFGFGVDYASVASHLVRRFIGEMSMRGLVPATRRRVYVGALGDARAQLKRVSSTLAPAKPNDVVVVASSLASLRLRLFELVTEQRVSEERSFQWHETDLLEEQTLDGTIMQLQDVLRLRYRRLTGAKAVCVGGLVAYQFGPHRSVSFRSAMALGEILFRITYEEFYLRSNADLANNRATAAWEYATLMSEPVVRRTLARRIAKSSDWAARLPFVAHRIDCWNTPVWLGSIDRSSSVAERK